MKYKIILVPFPFDNLLQTKVRPAICLTDKISNYNHVVIAFITSNLSTATEKTDIKITDLTQTGLKVISAIKLHRIVTISTKLIKRELGELPLSYHNFVNEKLRELFKLN